MRTKADYIEMGIRARAAYWTPAKVAARRQINQDRLREARTTKGMVKLRIFPSACTRALKGPHWPFQALVGEAWTFTVPEVVDVWELLQDAGVFFRAWRPRRLRSTERAAAHGRLLTDWERLSQ